jgi:hypothetical protein
MTFQKTFAAHFAASAIAAISLLSVSPCVSAQRNSLPGQAQNRRASARLDPAEPPEGRPALKLLPRSSGAISRSEIDPTGMRALIEQLVACGTRNSLGSWTNPSRGPGCAREHIAARLNEIAKTSGGRLQVVIDQFEGTSARTNDKPAHM